jgi:hypothetical protein
VSRQGFIPTASDFLAGFDLDCFPGGRIAAHASGALSNLQNAETRNTDPLALLEMLRDQPDEIAEEGFTGPLRQLMLLGQAGSEMLESDWTIGRFRLS